MVSYWIVFTRVRSVWIFQSTIFEVIALPQHCATSEAEQEPSSKILLVLYNQYRCLIWDFTCADTLCKSYVKKASKEVGSAAAGREAKKVDKYSNLSDYYHFVPVGIETYGAYGPQGIKLVKQIGKKIQDATGEKLSTFYLFQSISIAIQKGNAQCVQGCVKDRSSGLEGLFIFHVQEAEEL